MIFTSDPTVAPWASATAGGAAEVGASEAFLYLAGDRIEVASPSSGFERCPYLGQR